MTTDTPNPRIKATQPSEPTDAESDRSPPTPRGRLSAFWKRWRIGQRLGVALVVAAFVASLLTYAVFSGTATFLPATPSVLLTLLNLDLVLFLAVAVLVIRRVVKLWGERRRGTAGSGLHVRLVLLLSLVAGLPTVLVTTFSVLFLHFGLQSWFSEQVDAALTDSLTVAEAYLHEHGRAAARDTLAIAADLRRDDDVDVEEAGEDLTQFLERQLRLRSLEAALVFSPDGNVASAVGELTSLANELVPDWALSKAREGEVAVVVGRAGDQLRGLVRLQEEPERFLYVVRAVDQEVLRHIADIRAAVSRFQRLQTERSEIELTFAVIFALLTLLLVMVATWVGLAFAGRIARPIASLVEAAERVRAGDLEVRLGRMGELSEFQTLGRTFNRMTAQLRAQRQELIEANRQLDQRRLFTEAVLAGVAAGVVGLDNAGRIRFPNRMASLLLGIDLEQHRDTPLADLLPDVGPLIDRAHRWLGGTTEGQIVHATPDGARTFLVRVTAEAGGEAGTVVTFTDITELLDAQRKAAWSDIARRIAHEIKNPLTPIQLSAERLKRRYLSQVTNDPDTFQLCTDTIVRQVESLRRLVDEFSDFARQPAPQFVECNLAAIAREAIALQENAAPTVGFTLESPADPFTVVCDENQILRVLTNLLQNAAEAIERRLGEEGDAAEPGRITVALEHTGEATQIMVTDNGPGFPPHLRGRLADPYVTSRAKGTGLGLAIVQKIAADHGGNLVFQDAPEGGARVCVTIADTLPLQGS